MLRSATLFGIILILCAAVGHSQEKSITLVPVSYDGLKREVVKHRGKVLLVDFWASNCFPCKNAFPYFMNMQQKYADRGLVVITVSLDDPEAKKSVDAAQAFLIEKNAPFANFLLNAPKEVVTEKLAIGSLPCYYVFDRQGKWVRFGGLTDGTSVDYDELDRTVVQMLHEK